MYGVSYDGLTTALTLLHAETGPKPDEYGKSLNGYELPIAMEVRRGRYLKSFEHPQPLTPGKPEE
jgi:hypothetical protein